MCWGVVLPVPFGSRWPHVATEHWKWGLSKSKVLEVENILDFKGFIQKKIKHFLNNFNIGI